MFLVHQANPILLCFAQIAYNDKYDLSISSPVQEDRRILECKIYQRLRMIYLLLSLTVCGTYFLTIKAASEGIF